MSRCSIWMDSIDHDTFHLGKRYTGNRVILWASVSEEGMAELFGEGIKGFLAVMAPGAVHEIELEATVRE